MPIFAKKIVALLTYFTNIQKTSCKCLTANKKVLLYKQKSFEDITVEAQLDTRPFP